MLGLRGKPILLLFQRSHIVIVAYGTLTLIIWCLYGYKLINIALSSMNELFIQLLVYSVARLLL